MDFPGFEELGGGRIEPHADMREAATAIRQLYIAFIDAGFDEYQAMTLLIAQIGRT